MGTVYIAGAGMAGLAAAVHSVKAGRKVKLFEAANQAGGRCRSFHDSHLDCLIDNGNHLILGGNEAIFQYLEMVDAPKALTPARWVRFPFIDIETDEFWTVAPSAGRIPWWLLSSKQRIPGTRFADYLAILKMRNAGPNAVLSDYVDTNQPIFDRFWQPLCHAVLNTDASESTANLIWVMLSETLMKGAQASRPYFANDGLSAALVKPAVSFLAANNAAPAFGARIKSLAFDGDRITGFSCDGKNEELGQEDKLILALPPTETNELLSELETPNEFRAIVNVHFRVKRPAILPNQADFIGMIGSTAQWLFNRGDVYSVTISAADKLAEKPAEDIARLIWQEVAKVIGRDSTAVPPYRVIKEQRATIAQTPEQNVRRPDSATSYENLFLAGDWTDTGLPATVEGAVRSGRKAAELAGF